MQSFKLKIITADGIKFDGSAESVLVKGVTGNLSIWARHIDYVTALGIGKAVVTIDSQKKSAACSGGVLTVLNGDVTVLASTFEWQEEIDEERAKEALIKSKESLASLSDAKEIELAKLKIQRALTRIDVIKN